MKKYLMVFACFMSTMLKAQTPVEINLWPSDRLTDTAKGKKLAEHDVSKPNDDKVSGQTVIRLGDITNPTIKIFKPQNPNGTAVVVCPGGGYYILAMDLEGTEICEWFNSIGVTAILLKYRVPPLPGKLRYELPLQDAQRALGLVRLN
ncbi:MAG: hypothetical protein ABI113_19340, partial [Mucilaginibacter sp.]